MKRFLKRVYYFLRRIFIGLPAWMLQLVRNKELTSQPSYYPERNNHKSRVKVFFDQLVMVFKYGAPEQFYFMYGFDSMKWKEMNQYMHLYPFMAIRNSENFSDIHNASCILRNKIYFGMFADFWGVRTGKNVGISENGGVFLFTEKKNVSFKDFCSEREGFYFCKILDGECGEGIFTLELINNQIKVNGEDIPISKLNDLFTAATYLIQEKVTQHSEMSRLYPGSLNTIRLVTVKNKRTKEIKVFPSNLRIGAHGSFVDNGSQGGIAVGVHLESGKLFEYGLQKPPYGTKTKKHPDTGVEFATFVIPFFEEAKRQAIYLHSKLDGISSVGWDIAITERGPLFIEGNDNWELQAIQRTHGGLKKEFLKGIGVL